MENDSRPFWETCKPYFSNKIMKTSGNIILSDKEVLIFKKIEVAREFNSFTTDAVSCRNRIICRIIYDIGLSRERVNIHFQSITLFCDCSNGLTHLNH